MKSVITPQERFARVELPKIQRSTFDRSHGYKTTFDAGYLIPIFLEEALPGDTFNIRPTLFGRLATPLKPIMDNIMVDVHFFSVPLRLLWTNWKRFNGEQDDPADTTDYTIPISTATAVTGYGEMSLQDYMGLPTKVPGYEHSALFTRCYNLIWNQWYRDENLQDSVVVDLDDGPDSPSDYVLLPRGKRKDYFTSCLPWAQKASPVSIPLGTSAPIYGSGTFDNTDTQANRFYVYDSNGDKRSLTTGGNAGDYLYGKSAQTADNQLYADLSTATAATINSLREAFQVQRMYEKDARGGTRYIELIKSHFGVESPDARQQRAEFLGGFTVNVSVNPIAQNSEAGATPQGNLAAMGTVAGTGNPIIKSFTEHEIVIALCSARADLNYQQGLNRMWSRQTRFDFFWPTLAHLGEQAVLKQEIYTVGTGGATDDDVFGYQERYAEYRYKPSQVTGLFRSNATASLDTWHLSQEFGGVPSLNSTFIVENPPIDRVIAVPAEPQFILDCYFDFKAARPIPTYATPGLIDHF